MNSIYNTTLECVMNCIRNRYYMSSVQVWMLEHFINEVLKDYIVGEVDIALNSYDDRVDIKFIEKFKNEYIYLSYKL